MSPEFTHLLIATAVLPILSHEHERTANVIFQMFRAFDHVQHINVPDRPAFVTVPERF